MTRQRRDRFVILRRRARIGAAVAFLLAGAILGAAGLPDQRVLLATSHEQDTAIPVAPVVGAIAPDFAITTTSGLEVGLDALRGQVVLLNFWATWCGPCEAEIPALQALHHESEPDALVVLGINVDEPPAVFVPWADSRNVTFPLVADIGQRIQQLYHVRGTPQTIVIGPEGVIRDIFYGPVTARRLQQSVAGLL